MKIKSLKTKSETSAKIFGGVPDDYIAIHELMDKLIHEKNDVKYGIIFHSAFGCHKIIPAIFGHEIQNSNGKWVSTQEIAEYHILMDFNMKFIPTYQDWIENVEIKNWMNNAKNQ